MARTKKGSVPTYRLHRSSGRAAVTINGRDIYLDRGQIKGVEPECRVVSDHIDALEAALYESIYEHPIGDRKPRIHPREIKRRPKPYKLMKQPRHAPRRLAA